MATIRPIRLVTRCTWYASPSRCCPDTERAGVYRVTASRAGNGSASDGDNGAGAGRGSDNGAGVAGGDALLVAVNLDTRESDLERLEAGVLESTFRGRPFSYIPGDGSVQASVREVRFGRELWRLVLVLALAVAVVEVALSRGKGAFTPASS